MGAFICQISEQDWQKSKRIGLYGNRENKPDYSGELRTQDKMSVIRDLISVQSNDIIFFHVVRGQGVESSIHGIYLAEGNAFYDLGPIWDNSYEVFPYRFMFRPHPDFLSFTNKDAFIYVSELYKKVETRDIWSIATLENERNMEKRAVRKISLTDAMEIIALILKQPLFAEREEISYRFYSPPDSAVRLEEKVEKIDTIENSIKAFILSDLKNCGHNSEVFFGDVVDYMNETFVAQTTRKLFDLLIISSDLSLGKRFCILEAKTNNYGEGELQQLLHYMDLFKQKDIFNKKIDQVYGFALAQNFNQRLIELATYLNYIQIFDQLNLIKYSPNPNGREATFCKIEAPALVIDRAILSKHLLSDQISKIFSLYDEKKFRKESVRQNGFEIIKLSIRNLYGKEVHLMDYLLFEKNLINTEDLRSFLKKLKTYVGNFELDNYSEATLVLKFNSIEKTALEVVKIYNKILKRPPILII